jgi:hypothetical protein
MMMKDMMKADDGKPMMKKADMMKMNMN